MWHFSRHLPVNTWNLIYFCWGDKLPSKIKIIFTQNELFIPYNPRRGKLVFIPGVNLNLHSAKSLRCEGHVTWDHFSWSNNDNNFYNVGNSKFKNFQKSYVISQY